MRRVAVLLLVLMMVLCGRYVAGVDCPEGWEPLGCNNEWKCVIPMTSFDTEKACFKRGGIPGVTMCLSRGRKRVREENGRYCIKDLRIGKMRYSKKGK